MSLINEALKRAEAEKNRSGCGQEYQPPPIPDEPSARPANRRPRRSARAVALGCVAAAVAALGAWVMLDHGSPRPAPHAASADTARAPRPRSRLERPVLARAEKTDPRPRTKPALAGTPKAMKHHSASPRNPSRAGPVRPAAQTRPAAAAAPVKPQPDKATPPPPAPEFKLTGVLLGPGGGTAIINGRFMKVGDTIEGARVVKITKHAVTLELGARRITLRL